MRKRLILSGAAVFFTVLAGSAIAQEAEMFKGNVVTLGAEDDTLPASEVAEVNVDGLVVIKVHDKGSAAVDEVKVVADKGLKYLGSLRGIGVKDGHLLMGGGYTVCLLKAVDVAESANIKVTYKEAAHVGGESKIEEYKVKIVPFSED